MRTSFYKDNVLSFFPPKTIRFSLKFFAILYRKFRRYLPPEFHTYLLQALPKKLKPQKIIIRNKLSAPNFFFCVHGSCPPTEFLSSAPPFTDHMGFAHMGYYCECPT